MAIPIQYNPCFYLEIKCNKKRGFKTRNLNNNYTIRKWIKMKYKLLIVPGYLVGIGSLCIITYRTILAFFSESKAVTIHVNRYGEQYADIVFLIVIWIICLVGLIYLYLVMKEGKIAKVPEGNIRGKKVMSKDGSYLGILRDSLVDEKTGMIRGVIVEPSEEIDSRLYHLDDGGNLVVSFDSIKLGKESLKIDSTKYDSCE